MRVSRLGLGEHRDALACNNPCGKTVDIITFFYCNEVCSRKSWHGPTLPIISFPSRVKLFAVSLRRRGRMRLPQGRSRVGVSEMEPELGRFNSSLLSLSSIRVRPSAYDLFTQYLQISLLNFDATFIHGTVVAALQLSLAARETRKCLHA